MATKEKWELPVVPVWTHSRPGSISGVTQPPEHGGLQSHSDFRAWGLGTENPAPTLQQGVRVMHAVGRPQKGSMPQEQGGQLQHQHGNDRGGWELCTESQHQTPQQLCVSSKMG